MGNFYITCRVQTLDRRQSVDVTQLLVDTGSAYTWISKDVLERIGVAREAKNVAFTMANGRPVTRAIGFVILEVDGIETADEVVFGEPGDLQLLGARTLEGLNLRVDSVARKLVPGGPILAAAIK